AKAEATDTNLANAKAALAAAEKAYNEADGKDLTPTQLEALKNAVEAAKEVVSKTEEVKEAADKAVEEAQTALTAAQLEAEVVKAEEAVVKAADEDRKSTRLNSSHVSISYAVFCLKKKKEVRDRCADVSQL